MKYKTWRGQRFRIKRKNMRKLYGLCSYDKQLITIASDPISRRDLIDTAIHEVLHAEFPNANHEKIYHVAAGLARVIDKLLEKDGHCTKGERDGGHELNANAETAGSGIHGHGEGAGEASEQGSEYEGWSIDRQFGLPTYNDGV